MAVTRAQVYVGMYVDQVMLHALEHAERVGLSCLLVTSSGSHSRSSSIFVMHPVVLVEKSLEDISSRSWLGLLQGFDVCLPDR